MTSELLNNVWDVAIVGTGMGGSLLGRRLAESGFKVLFIERGPTGRRPQEHRLDSEIRDPIARSVRGFWPEPIYATINGVEREMLGTLGAGVGGTSVFYAACLERPEVHDIDDTENAPHPVGGWPVSAEQFRPWFDEAERLLEVCGGPVPFASANEASVRTPPPAAAGDLNIMEDLRQSGLHPYRMHLGLRYLPGCRECTGHLCAKNCKMDGRSAGVEPALLTGRAALVDNCEVIAICATHNSISHLDALWHGQPVRIKARRYVLSGGAIGTARLLLASRSELWPDGCANRSGLVGRNLMFHLNDLIALWPRRADSFDGPAKTLMLRDFYYYEKQRLGSVQSLGISANYGDIARYLDQQCERNLLRHLPGHLIALRVAAAVGARVLGQARILVALLEDLPYPHNRVSLKDGDLRRVKVEYSFSDELMQRHEMFRRTIKKGFRRNRHLFLTRSPELNLGHPCGTARFGTNVKKSVLDRDCRAHDINNLYVVDSSFMPTSTGMNPSLTIAANALRVADRLGATFQDQSYDWADGL